MLNLLALTLLNVYLDKGIVLFICAYSLELMGELLPVNRKDIELDFIESVNYERVKALYKAATSQGLLSSFLVISFIPLFLWSQVDHTVIGAWTVSIVTVNILRIYLLKQFNRLLTSNKITKENATKWEWYFVIGIALIGLVWTTATFFPFHGNALASRLYILLILVGINAAIVSMYMASRNTMLAYLTITLIPGFGRVAWGGDTPNIVIGLLGIVFISIMIKSIKSNSRNLIEIITLKLKNEELSKKDALTGLWNRRQLYAFVDKLIPAATKETTPFSILMMDIDFFKKYNDTHGHSAGDILLRQVSQLILSKIRDVDLAVRYGGEEFMVIFVNMEITNAKIIAERLRVAIRDETDVTVSSGLVEFEPGVAFDDLTKKADMLLYKAKESGRDVTVVDVNNL